MTVRQVITLNFGIATTHQQADIVPLGGEIEWRHGCQEIRYMPDGDHGAVLESRHYCAWRLRVGMQRNNMIKTVVKKAKAYCKAGGAVIGLIRLLGQFSRLGIHGRNAGRSSDGYDEEQCEEELSHDALRSGGFLQPGPVHAHAPVPPPG